MKLLVFRALWGMEGSLSAQIRAIAAVGYDGVEGIPPGVKPSEYTAMLADHGLRLIAHVFATTAGEFREALARVADYLPMKVVARTGRDHMSREDGCALLGQALEAERTFGIEVGHETQRGRLFYTPWDTAFYLEQFADIRLTVDLSHWINVCERLPDDQPDALRLACDRAIHIHGRVGYEQGPQVPDPSAPECRRYVEWHEAHWQRVRHAHEQAGRNTITFTPEFGPPGYLHTLPHTNVPVADLWQVCLWGARRMRATWRDIA